MLLFVVSAYNESDMRGEKVGNNTECLSTRGDTRTTNNWFQQAHLRRIHRFRVTEKTYV